MTEQVYKQIKEVSERSAGRCGIYRQNIKGDYKKVTEALKILWKQKLIRVAEGTQGQLIFLR